MLSLTCGLFIPKDKWKKKCTPANSLALMGQIFKFISLTE